MRTGLVALLVVAVVGGSAFSLQAVGLGSVTSANAIAARAAGWFLRYRYAVSTIDARGRTIGGQCYHGWFDGGSRRGTLLLLSNGGSVRATAKRIVATRSFTVAPVNALELAGCTHVLGPRIASLAQFDSSVGLTHAWLGGRRVLALHFQHLVLFVAPTTHRPLGALLHGVKSRISLERLTPSTAARLQAA